jgi:hypothetical protein
VSSRDCRLILRSGIHNTVDPVWRSPDVAALQLLTHSSGKFSRRLLAPLDRTSSALRIALFSHEQIAVLTWSTEEDEDKTCEEFLQYSQTVSYC